MDLNDDDQIRNHSDNDEDEADTTDAHEIALELMKQIITLASGVVALSATFLEKLNMGMISMFILSLSWAALIISILFGLQTISAIVKSRLDSTREWSKGAGKTYARISKYAFVIGIFLFATFAFSLFVLTHHSTTAFYSRFPSM